VTSAISLLADARWAGLDIERVVLSSGARRVRFQSRYAVVLTDSGSGVVRCAGQMNRSSPHRGCVLAPACLWTAEASATGWSYTTLCISSQTLRALADGVGMGAQLPPRGATSAVGEATAAAARRVVEEFAGERRLVQGLGALVDLAAALTESSPAMTDRSTPPAIVRARTYLEQRSRNVPSRHVARHVGLSPFHFIRLFRRAVGVPPSAYATLVRIGRAERLLRAGVPIAHAAEAAGFYDQSHLNRCFRRFVGITPSEYRRSCVVRHRPTITLDTFFAYRLRTGEPLLRRWAQLRRSRRR
jgi:AraC-like DNA-binding protein